MEPNARLLVGIDFSRDRADFALLTSEGHPLYAHRAFPNSLSGFQQAKQLLLEVLSEDHFSGVDIAGEATNYYWLPFFQQLNQDPELAVHDPQLYLLNARWVHWYKKSLPPDHKDDPTDPRYIGGRLRLQRPQTAWKLDPKWMPLRFFTRLRRHLLKSQGRSKNLCQVYLFLAYSTYPRYRPFSEALPVTLQRLLQQPELLARLPDLELEELAATLWEVSGHHLPQPLQNAARWQQVLRDSIPPAEALAGPIQASLEVLIHTIQDLQAQIEQVEQLMRAAVAADYPEVAWLESIPGVGFSTACGIAAEVAGIERFAQEPKWDTTRRCWRRRRTKEIEDAVAKYAGLWWPKNASGQFNAEERPLSREGNAYLRYYVIEAGEHMRRVLPSYGAYYQKKYDEASKHKHKRGQVLTGRKALGLFVSLLLRQEPYRAEEAHRSPA